MPAAGGEWLPRGEGQDSQPRAEQTERHREATQSGCDNLPGKVDGSVMLQRCGETLSGLRCYSCLLDGSGCCSLRR